MPQTLYDKIWNEHMVHQQADGTTLLYVDRHLIHEVTSPQAFEGLRLAKRKVRKPNLTLAVADHNVPTTNRSKGIEDQESKVQIETLEKKSATEFAATVTAKVGPVKAKFAGQVTLSDLDRPRGYRITGEGQGGVAGFAKGTCLVTLAGSEGKTELSYEAEAQVGGKLAQIGSRMVAGVARKMADEFFGAFAEQIGSGATCTGEVVASNQLVNDREKTDKSNKY